VERVSMEDIAQKAELSKATVYLYFSGKEVLFNEICEESARAFLGRFKPFLESGLTGIAAMKCFWRGYVELFGNSDEMVLIFQVRTFTDTWLPIASHENQSKSPSVGAILEAMKNIIDQCKAEGIFDPNLDSALATRLLLSVFSIIVGNAARIPAGSGKSAMIINEMTSAFQIMVRGFAKEGVDRSHLDLKCG